MTVPLIPARYPDVAVSISDHHEDAFIRGEVFIQFRVRVPRTAVTGPPDELNTLLEPALAAVQQLHTTAADRYERRGAWQDEANDQ